MFQDVNNIINDIYNILIKVNPKKQSFELNKYVKCFEKIKEYPSRVSYLNEELIELTELL
jgi:CRISPR/Cas system-associated protein Csm6